MLYVLTAITFAGIGFMSKYWTTAKPNQLRAAELPPNALFDEILGVDVWKEPHRYVRSKSNIALVTETQGSVENPRIRFWCATQYDRWGVIDYVFPLDSSRRLKSALLEHEVCVFGMLDPTAEAEMWVDADGNGKFELVGHLQDRVQSRFPSVVDVTQWANGRSQLQIRYRLKAGRLLFHPSPNDPIGYAGAQACRSVEGDGAVLRLHLEYDETPGI